MSTRPMRVSPSQKIALALEAWVEKVLNTDTIPSKWDNRTSEYQTRVLLKLKRVAEKELEARA